MKAWGAARQVSNMDLFPLARGCAPRCSAIFHSDPVSAAKGINQPMHAAGPWGKHKAAARYTFVFFESIKDVRKYLFSPRTFFFFFFSIPLYLPLPSEQRAAMHCDHLLACWKQTRTKCYAIPGLMGRNPCPFLAMNPIPVPPNHSRVMLRGPGSTARPCLGMGAAQAALRGEGGDGQRGI